MKYLNLLAVFAVATGISVAFRQGMSGSSDASQSVPSQERQERAAGLRAAALIDHPTAAGPVQDEGAAQPSQAASLGATGRTSSLALARLAAEAGHSLLASAMQSPDNPHLLNQAVAHFNACLSHEPTTAGAAALFAEVRGKLLEAEREAVRRHRPGVAKSTKKSPHGHAVVKSLTGEPEEPESTADARPPQGGGSVMVGPDGVTIERVGPGD